jgi:magnesium chelatase subunit I
LNQVSSLRPTGGSSTWTRSICSMITSWMCCWTRRPWASTSWNALRPQLLDRFGLCVNIESIADPEQRVEIVKRWSFFEGEPLKMMASYADAERELADQILKARALLPSVRIADPLLQRIAEIGIALQVDGHRSDLVMMKAAKTVASFRGRQQVGDDDVEAVIELALTHRMRRRPFEERAIDRSLIDDRAPRADGGKGR